MRIAYFPRSKPIMYTAKQKEIADANACKLAHLFPERVLTQAILTGTITLGGLTVVGNALPSVLVKLNTSGFIPPRDSGECNWAKHTNGVIESKRWEAADAILSPFGLNIVRLYETYGVPVNGEKIVLKLSDIIQ